MAYKRSYKRKAKRTSRYGKRRPLRTTTVSPRVKLYVKKALARNIENKAKDVEYTSKNFSSIIDDTSIVNLLPNIQQGTTESTRIGNKIKPKRLSLRMSITLAPISGLITNPSPTYVDIYIFKTKYQNNWDGAISAADMNEFLQNDSSSQQYTGAVLDGMRPLNTDVFKQCIHKRIMLYNAGSAVAHYGATASINPNRMLTFNLTGFIKKHWTFDDNVAQCTNDNLYMVVGTTQTDGASTLTYTTGNYQALVNMSYEDA